MKAEEDTESAEHTYIIINKINTEGDELADKAEVIEVDDGNQDDYNTVLARDIVCSLECAGMVEICLTLLFITSLSNVCV